MRIITEPKYDFDDVLLLPKRSTLSSRSEAIIDRSFTFKWSNVKWTGIPIIASNMDSVGTIEMANALKQHHVSTALHKHYDAETLLQIMSSQDPYVWYSLGITQKDIEKYEAVKQGLGKSLPYVVIDVANGYTESFVEFVSNFRKTNPTTTLMVGNVVTAEMTEQLILAGADIVKVGIGPGSVCTTRKITGVGYPQLSAVIECADAAHGLGGLVCSDGGCKVPGDVAKSFAAGADFVMLGGMLAGHTEGGGQDYVNSDGKRYREFYGMSSKAAQDKHNGGVANYRASEGKRVLIPYRGDVDATIREILGGLRSACTYVGARKLKELPKRATFIVVNRQRNTIFDQYDTH